MKLGTKGWLGFFLAGILALVTSFEKSFIPWQVKVTVGVILTGYGLLIFFKNKNNLGSFPRWIIPAVLVVAAAGGFYYYYKMPPPKKVYTRLEGTFEVNLFNQKAAGNAILEGNKLTLRFRVPPSGLQVNDLTFASDTIISKKSISMVCALTHDYQVIRCSDVKPFIRFQELFFDQGYFTAMYLFYDPLAVDDIEKISFVLHTNKGDESIKINRFQP